jgi:tetratricopeptide (TPR) repeat protein
MDNGRWFKFQANDVQAVEGKVREEKENERYQLEPAAWTGVVGKVQGQVQAQAQAVLSSPAARSLASSLASATPASHLPLSAHNSPLPMMSSPSTLTKPKTRSSPVTSPPHTRSSSLSSPRPLVAGVKRVTGQQKLPFQSVKERKVKDKKVEGAGHVRTRSVTGGGMSGKKKLSDVMEMEMGEGWTGEEEDDRKEADKGEEMTEEEDQSDELRDRLQRSADAISSLFRTLCSAYTELCQYHPTQCIDLLSSLPPSHSRTPFVLSSLARAHFEYLDYPTCIVHYQRYRILYPHHLHSLDLYSTALWNTKKESLLSSLSHSLSSHPLTPITCVIIGNTFSLQRDHDTAIRFFRRAISLDPLYPYPHVLIGHELLAMEDFTGALTEYRRAIALDGRAYGGWYGVGSLLYQQEKWEGALYHFRQARRVNGGSGVLIVYEAMTLCQLGRVDEAERVLKERVNGGREDAQVLYQLAVVMTMKKEWEEALEWVERVEGLVWREASVWVLKGKVLKRLGRWEEAMRALVVAMDLDPKDSNGVKQQLEKLLTRGGKKGAVEDEEDEKVDDEGY